MNGLLSDMDKIEYNILGTPCSAFCSHQEAVDHLKLLVHSGASGYSVAINAEKVIRCLEDITFKGIVDQAVIKVPDGAGAVLGLSILHNVHSKKIDFPQAALLAAEQMGESCRLALIGASEESHIAAVAEVRRRYPSANIVLARPGFTPEHVLLEELVKTTPNLCLLAMGTPKQEKFAHYAVSQGVKCLFVGCGGAFDIMSGHAVRAPKWMVDHYLEWAYRLWQQPSRWRRQLVLPRFMLKLIAARFTSSIR